MAHKQAIIEGCFIFLSLVTLLLWMCFIPFVSVRQSVFVFILYNKTYFVNIAVALMYWKQREYFGFSMQIRHYEDLTGHINK